MAWQLIYTSAPRTLTAGQTGYGTVARSLDLRDALIQRLEQLSYFQHGDNRVTTPPVIHAYRIIDLRGAKYHVLTRLVDAGLVSPTAPTISRIILSSRRRNLARYLRPR
jgi:hypothetical protein